MRRWFPIALLIPLASAAAADFQELSRQATEARQSNRPAEAVRLYQQALRLDPSWGDGWWNLGSVLYEQADYTGARQAFRKLTEIDPKAAPGFVFLGLSEYKLKDYDAALRDLDTARLLGLPNGHAVTTAARYYLAVLLIRNGMHDAAAGLLLSLATAGGESPEICEAFGMAGLRIAKLPEELTPDERQLTRAVGQALAAAGQRRQQQSLAALADLVKHHPRQPNLHYVYGTLLLDADSAQAVAQFQEELKVQPASVPAMLALAREMERQVRYADARAYAERAVQAEPANFETHAILGRILAAQGHFAEGLTELERAKGLEPGSPQIYFALASVYAKLGRDEDAKSARAEFLRLRHLADEQK